MSSSLPNKKQLTEAAQGPSWVRSIGDVEALGIGRGVRALYGRWFDFQQERRRRQHDAPAIEAFRANAPPLAPLQQHVLESLRAKGFASADVRALAGGDRWTELRDLVEPWLATEDMRKAERAYQTSEDRKWKDYLVRMFGRESRIPIGSPLIQLAAAPAILDVVNTYLGMFSKVLYVDVWNTVPLVHEGPNMGSQRWHRDPEDAKLVKVFLYFNDVDADSGAMQYVPNSRRGERFGGLWPQEFPKGSVPPPEEFEREIPPSEWHTCAYPTGTLVFVDTSGFHRGGRATTSRRVVGTWTFTRQSSVWPRAFQLVGIPPADVSPGYRFALLS
jgi:hypothetical protein